MFNDIIWDFDGTLFDTYPGMVHSFKLALQDAGIHEDENNILEYMRLSMMEAVNHFTEKYGLKDDFLERMKGYDKNLGLDMVRPFPYTEEICRRIWEKGKRNFVLTHRGYSTNDILRRYHMDDYFTEVITKHNGFKRKPDAEGYIYLIEKYGMEKEATIIIGDRELEIKAARMAGVKVCLYNTNNICYEVEPDYKINSLKELEDIIYL